ncbi:MAG: YdcF family protein [Candidatus Korobacteraceae bacterium]
MAGAGRRWLRRIGAALLAVYAGYFAWTCAAIVAQSRHDEVQPADAIVVFGAAEYFGRPSPVYRARLDHAFDLYERKLAPVVITTGGSGGEPTFTEGQVGHDYLVGRGISDPHLIAETQSDNSAESAERVAVIMAANGMRSCIAVSDPYHVYRIKQLLEAQGVVVCTSPRRLETEPGIGTQALNVARESLSYTLWRLHLFRW